MTSTRKRQIHDLLKGIETGDPAAVEVADVGNTEANRVLAEGDFVLAVTEGFRSGVHTSFYDLFRVADGRVVEHWDTTNEVPPRSEWKNNNGKF